MKPGRTIPMSRPATEPASKSSRRRGTLRRSWLAVHRWLGVALAILFLLLGLSGSVLALKGPVLRWEMGAAPWQMPEQAAPMMNEEQASDSAQQALPELGRIMGVVPPHKGFFDSPNLTVFGAVEGRDRAMGVGFLDPVTGERRGFAIYDDLLIARVVALHRSLLLPLPIGGPLLAAAGLFLLISTITGLWLWWPRKADWRKALFPSSLRSGKMRMMEFHRWVGAWLAFPMLVLAGSGIWLAMPQIWMRLLGMAIQGGRGGASTMAQLHADLLLGSFGAAVVFLSGITLAALCVTGLWAWWRSIFRS